MENMTLKEKSTWLSLLAILFVFGKYTLQVLSIDLASVSKDEAIDLVMANMCSAVFLIIIIRLL